MYSLIGDIGNTVTKICLIDSKNFKIKKIIYFHSKDIKSNFHLTRNLKKIIKDKKIEKISLFSSVVPKYYFMLKKLIKKRYKIKYFKKNPLDF